MNQFSDIEDRELELQKKRLMEDSSSSSDRSDTNTFVSALAHTAKASPQDITMLKWIAPLCPG